MNSPNPQSEIRNPKLRWACALIVALLTFSAPPSAFARHTDSVPVFQCTFGDDWDVNYDGWPDRWVRKTGADYPHYVNIAIQEDDTAANHKCLTIDLDGSAAAIVSPPIRVMSRFSYAFEAQLKNEDLKYSSVVVTLDFCDSSGRVLQSAKTESYTSTHGWQTISLGPVEPSDPAIDRAVLTLQVQRGNKGDLQGRVSLADVRLQRQPRIDVTTNNHCNVYSELGGVEIRCALSGIGERDPEIHFQLLDAANHELQSEHRRLNGQLIVNKNKPAVATGVTEGGDGPDGYECTTNWQPKIPDYGFYRVAVRMMSSETAANQNDAERQLERRTVDLVVVPPLGVDMPRRGEFGWTLPDGDRPLSFQDLARLLPQVGINWAKVPVWFDASDPHRGDELIRFVELLGASNIDVVGIIDHPPAKAKDSGRTPRDISIADVLSQDSAIWSAALEPVMSRLALRVRWWQLGRDYDTSLISLTTLNKRIADLRTALFRFGQDVRMGLCADWESAETHTGDVSWDFTQLVAQNQPTKKQFDELLARPRLNSAQRWIVVDPPAPTAYQPPPTAADVAMYAPHQAALNGYTLQIPAWIESASEAPAKCEAARAARACAFVHRLVSAKLRGADAIIIAKPFNDENGLMRADGMPAELLLPWRTTSAMLGGAQYLGELQLPGSSENRIFLRPDGQVVMVAWNRKPTREVLYLGNNVRQYDLVGRATPAAQQGREQAIDVGPTPTFVLGLHEAVTRWRMNVNFENTQVPSVFSKPHHNALTFQNFFPQGVGGSVKIVVMQDPNSMDSPSRSETATGFAPDRWTIEPPRAAFQLAAGAETKFPFDIKLKNALYGEQPMRIDFTIEADERLEFSAYRKMEVGTADLTLEVKSHLDKDDTLIVEQRMINLTDHLADFKCHLRCKGHQPQRMQVYRLGHDPDRKIYRIPDGGKLVGEVMWLEIEELNGSRMLNYRFVAGEQLQEQLESDAAGDSDSNSSEKPEASNTISPLAKLGS